MTNLDTIAIEQMVREKEADMEATAKEAVKSGRTWWFIAGATVAFVATEALMVTAFMLASVLK